MARRAHLAGVIRPGSGKNRPEELDELSAGMRPGTSLPATSLNRNLTSPAATMTKSGSAASLSPTRSKPGAVAMNTNTGNAVWHEVFEMCKKGFTTKMHSVGDEILHEVRGEVTQNIQKLREEVSSMLEARDKMADDRSVLLMRKMEQVQKTAEKGIVDLSQVDLSPVLEEIKIAGNSQSQVSKSLEDHLVSIQQQISQVQVRADVEEEKIQKLGDHQGVIENMLSNVSKAQEMYFVSSESIAEEVKAMRSRLEQVERQASTSADELREEIERQFEEHAQEPTDVAFTEVKREIKRTQNVINSDFKMMLNEIGRIQQALNLDFVSYDDDEPESQSSGHRTTSHSIVDALKMSTEGGDSGQRSSEASLRSLMMARRQSMSVDVSLASKTKKRVREIFCQTDEKQTTQCWVQTDPVKFEKKAPQKLKNAKTNLAGAKNEDNKPKLGGFQDAEALKAKARQALVKPQYNVFDRYKEEGYAQRIAKTSCFENLTLVIVFINALWIAVDTDNNSAAIVTNAHPVFIVAENMFCLYFTGELLIRFIAFQWKRHAFQDRWFVFDFFLVLLMVAETWILPIFAFAFRLTEQDIAQTVDISFLRLFRMVKILRVSRLLKLLRAIPELVIIVKGIAIASRSVAVFLTLWVMIIYVFAIVLTQLSGGDDIGTAYFSSVSHSMSTLFLNGIVPEQAQIIIAAGNANWYFWIILMLFTLLASITIMYMMVGVLVEVMGMISASEKEGMTVSYVATSIRETMSMLSYPTETPLSQQQFEKLLVEPDIANVLVGIGVDVVGLVDSMDVIFSDLAKSGESMTFENLVELFLNMRGNNQATVKDVKDSLRVVKMVIIDSVKSFQKQVTDEFKQMRGDILTLTEETRRHNDTEDAEYEEDEEVAVEEAEGDADA